MDHEEGKCNAPVWGKYVRSIVGYCTFHKDHTDRCQRAVEVQGGYRSISEQREELLEEEY